MEQPTVTTASAIRGRNRSIANALPRDWRPAPSSRATSRGRRPRHHHRPTFAASVPQSVHENRTERLRDVRAVTAALDAVADDTQIAVVAVSVDGAATRDRIGDRSSCDYRPALAAKLGHKSSFIFRRDDPAPTRLEDPLLHGVGRKSYILSKLADSRTPSGLRLQPGDNSGAMGCLRTSPRRPWPSLRQDPRTDLESGSDGAATHPTERGQVLSEA